MEKDVIEQAAEEIAVQAAVGPGELPGSRVANSLSPHFKHYTSERMRQVLREVAHKQMDALAEHIREFEASMAIEDAKVASVMAPETPNADAARAIAADAAKTRSQLIEGLAMRIRALFNLTIV